MSWKSLEIGSPPRMRVKLVLVVVVDIDTGITPAHAGKTFNLYFFCVSYRDHPRACG